MALCFVRRRAVYMHFSLCCLHGLNDVYTLAGQGTYQPALLHLSLLVTHQHCRSGAGAKRARVRSDLAVRATTPLSRLCEGRCDEVSQPATRKVVLGFRSCACSAELSAEDLAASHGLCGRDWRRWCCAVRNLLVGKRRVALVLDGACSFS